MLSSAAWSAPRVKSSASAAPVLGGTIGGGVAALVAIPLIGLSAATGGLGIAGLGVLAAGVMAGGCAGHKLGKAIDCGAGRLGDKIAANNQGDPQTTRALVKTGVAALVTLPLGLTPLALFAIGIGGLIGAGQGGEQPQQPQQPPQPQH